MTELNPLIALSGRPFEVGNALLQGRASNDTHKAVNQNIKQSEQAVLESQGRVGANEQRTKLEAEKAQQVRDDRRLGSIGAAALSLKNLKPAQRMQFLQKRKAQIEADKAAGMDIDSVETDEFIGLLESSPEEAEAILDMAVSAASSRGLIDSTGFQQGVKSSAVTRTYDNGVSMQVMNNGRTVVTDPAGNVLEGEARVQALANANQHEIDKAQKVSGARKAGAANIQLSTDAFERLRPVKDSIANIDNAIALLGEDGASTGPIISKLPSIRAASVQLDNIQKRMGLDVIGETTFGALSTGELNLALSTALPTGLEPEQLKNWLMEKKSAQQKLAGYLEDVAVFFSVPGNTAGDWIKAQKELGQSSNSPPTTNAQGWGLQVDANGNRAYVGPNGEVEEL